MTTFPFQLTHEPCQWNSTVKKPKDEWIIYIHEILIYKTVEWIMISLTNPHLTTSTLKIHFNNNLSPTAQHPKWFPHLTCTKWHCEIWSSHSSDYTRYCLLGLMCRAIQIYQRFKQTYCIHPQGRAQAGDSRLFQNSTFLPDYMASNTTGQCPQTILHMHVLPISTYLI